MTSPQPLIETRAVLFDLDGVLIHSERVWHAVLNAAARRFATPAIDDATFKAAWGQGLVADRDSFFPEQSLEEVAAFYDAEFPAHLDQMRVNPATPAVFEALEALGLASAVVTNTPNPLAWRLVRVAGAIPDHVVGGNEVLHPKPAPDMVLRAAELLGLPPGDCVLMGDSRFDRDAAEAAGTPFAGLGIDGRWRFERLEDIVPRLALAT